MEIVSPYDLDVHQVWSEGDRPEIEGTVPRGAPTPGDVQAALAPGKRHLVVGGWSVEAVGMALTDWATRHAGRPDLRLEWDPEGEPYPAVARAAERAKEIEEGGPVWDLGDGLVVADGLMDELLAMDQDEREELLKAFRGAHGRIFGSGDDSGPRR